MKTKHEAACDHADKPNMSNNRMFRSCTIEDFKAGVEFAESWIDVNEELPDVNVEVLFKTINCDLRVGYRHIDNLGWCATGSWFYSDKDVTYWRPINRP